MGLALLANWWHPKLQFEISKQTLVAILVPATLIFLLGVYDDLRTAGPYLKFGVQAIAASMLFMGGLRVLDVPVLFGGHQFGWFIGLPLTILWVLAVTNAFNLIDGLDGLAAGSALFSTTVVFITALTSGSSSVSLMTLALAGATLGFLRYNFNPATIFLGDSGSLFIGFMLSALALRGSQKAPTFVAVAIPVVSFGLPILETVLSVVRRFLSGRPVFTADREHIHHKLLQLGMTQRQAVIVLYAVSGLFALLSLFLLWPTGSTLGLVLAVVGAGVWIGVQHLNYLEFGELRRVAQRTIDQRQVFLNNLAVRRAIEELKVVQDHEQLGRILTAAFDSSDFDGFDLRLHRNGRYRLDSGHRRDDWCRWNRPGSNVDISTASAWRLTFDLISSGGRHQGTLILHRVYSERDLQLDIGLLTSTFPVVLADALYRISILAQDMALVGESTALSAVAQSG